MSKQKAALNYLSAVGAALVCVVLAVVAAPTAAIAAECTDSWTGPAEGAWGTASNWSANHVPAESDVACVGVGKTVNVTAGIKVVGGIQGEGTVTLQESTLSIVGTGEMWHVGALKMRYHGELSGPGSLEIAHAFSWEGESIMGAGGKTVLGPEAVSSITPGNRWVAVDNRTLVNEGTLTIPSFGTLAMAHGGIFENLGTFTVNGEGSPSQVISEGAEAKFVNRGVFRKTEGSGSARVESNFENLGMVDAATGWIRFLGEGRSTVFGDGGQIEGVVSCEKTPVTLNSFTAPKADISFSREQVTIPAGKTASIGTLRMLYQGNITGSGTLEVSKALDWEGESVMGSGGTTVLGPEAVSTIAPGNVWVAVAGRTIVNEGTVNLAGYGALAESDGGVFENRGTFNLNGEKSLWQIVSEDPGSMFLNKGLFRKAEGTGAANVESNFENLGTIEATTGTLEFKGEGHAVVLGDGSQIEGKASFRKTAVVLNDLTLPKAEISFREDPVAISTGKIASIGTLTVGYGASLGGAGTLEVTEAFNWESVNTMSGPGKTVLAPGTSTVLKEGTPTLSQRILINEGTFTQSGSSRLNLNSGAVFKNRGTYNLNAEPWPTWVKQVIQNEGGGPGFIVNSGYFQRTKGELSVAVSPVVENLGTIKGESSKIEIEHPEQLTASEKAGKECEARDGDPVNCATGNFTESQVDLAIAARGADLDILRSYSAQGAAAATSPGALGYGWSGTFSDHLTIEEAGAKVTLTKGDGSTIPFTLLSGATYAGPAWSQETLSGSPEAGFAFTASDQTQMHFSGAGRLESIVDRNGNQTTFAYEGSRLKSASDPAGRQLTFAYNAGGQVESVTDPLGHVVKYAYESGNLTSVTMPGEASPRWQFKYDASHRITSVTDGRGGKTTNEYDSANRVVSQTDPAGRTLTFKYEAFHTTITNKATGAVKDEWFTSNHEPFSITRGFGTPQATTSTFAYDEAAQLIRATDGNGHTTTYGYDEAGNRTSEKDPLGHETTWAFDSAHDLVSTTTPRGETTTIKRDSHGNVESISRPAPGGATQTTSFKHDKYGELESITDPLSRTWTFGYDSYEDRTSETDPLGHKQTTTYDKDSRLVSIVSPRGNVEGAKASEYETTVQRDAQGRPLKVTDPLGHATEYAYDANGNLASVTDAKGHTTKYTYNADDERTKVEKPTGATLETGYDGAGYVTSQTDANAKTTTYLRNVLEQPVEVIDPLGRKTTESFDAAGNVAGVTDPEGRKATYTYDAAGRLTGVDYSDPATPDATFEYDADGNLTAMHDGTGASSFTYDQLGRLTRSQDGHGDVVEYSYDLGEEQTGIVYPNGKSVSRVYDAAGRLESLTDWLGGKTSFSYDADSNLKTIAHPSASGNLDEYSYDRASRISGASFKKGSETLASLTYTRDALGQVEKEARSGLPGPVEVSFGYDANNRLTKAGSASYEYDKADNLTSAPGTANAYDAAAELEKGTGTSYAYDKEGERTSATTRTAEAPAFGLSFGNQSSGPGHLSAPAGIATDAEGNAWVADTGHDRIQEFNYKGEFVRQLGSSGTANGQFSSPKIVALDPKGNLWVADSSRIQELKQNGEYIRTLGSVSSLQDLTIDPSGNLWTLETTKSTARIQKFSSEGALLTSTFLTVGSENGQLKEAKGIAADAAGNLWIADTGNNRLQELKPNLEFIRKFGAEGSGNGQFKGPTDVAVDPEGKLWILDAGNTRVERFSAEGTYLSQFGAPGSNNGQFSEPQEIAADSKGNVWIADTGNDRVQEISGAEFLRQFGGESSGPGQLSAPAGVATDSEGNAWVADTGHNRVQEFNVKGEFIRQFGSAGSGNGQFSSPKSIAIDAKGNLWVADATRLQEFKPNGEFIRAVSAASSPQDITIDPSGNLWTLEGKTSIRIQKFSSEGALLSSTSMTTGSENGQVKEPKGIAADAAGNLWIADTGNNRVQELKPNLEFIRKFGSEGTGNGQFKGPVDLTLDPEGKVWVVDLGNTRIERFTAEGTYLSQFGSSGPNNGQFSEPQEIAAGSKGNLWIADTGNDRVQEVAGAEFIRQFGGESSGPGHLSAPAGIATDSEGNAWVADTGHDRIQEFNSKGEFVRQFGVSGSGNGQFNSPKAVAIDAKGNLWVADTRLQEFNAKGEYLRQIASLGTGTFFNLTGLAADPEGHIWTLERESSPGKARLQEFNAEGTYLAKFEFTVGKEAGQLKEARALAIDPKADFWIADTGNTRIAEFNTKGEFIRTAGSDGTGNGQFKSPKGIATDAEGNVWVTDTTNDRVQEFSSAGVYLAQVGKAGPNAGQFSEPTGLTADAKGNLWVADAGNDRVQEFTWPTSVTAYAYDQAGDLTSIQRPAAESIPAINETLAYDATGLLASRTTGPTTHHLSWDASTSLPLLLHDGENDYVYGPGGLPIEQITSSGEPTYLHHDQLGSTRLLTDASGKTSATFSYSAYGGVEAKTGSATTPLGFAGQYTDAESGLQYLRARFFDPATGQFLSRDPLEALTREPYDYAADNPLSFEDPGGLNVWEEVEGGGIPCWWCGGAEAGAEAIEGAAGDAEWLLQHSLGVEELDEGKIEVRRAQAEEEKEQDCSAERNPAQDKQLTSGEIKRLKKAGEHPHDLKQGDSRADLYKDREGNIYVKPKGGAGPGEPLGINIKEIP